MAKKKQTVFITGGAGFIGSNTLIYLFDKYPAYNFIVLDVLTYASDLQNIPDRIKKSKNFIFWYGDVRSGHLVEKLVSQSDIVIHFAAETHVSRSIFDSDTFLETDIIGTQRVANAVMRNKKKVKRFIHISTSEVYGTALGKKMDETHQLNPQSPYAAAKVGADRLVYSYIATYKIPAVIIRPFNMYGPQQHLEKVIPRFVTSSILGEPLIIHGTGDSRRDFTYVEDLARAIDMIMHAPAKKVEGEVFNVGQSEDYSIRSIADTIMKMKKEYHAKKNIKHTSYALNVENRPGQVLRHTADTSKIYKTLGWKPSIPFDVGLKKTFDWYSKNREWWKDKVWMRCVPIETETGKVELH